MIKEPNAKRLAYRMFKSFDYYIEAKEQGMILVKAVPQIGGSA